MCGVNMVNFNEVAIRAETGPMMAEQDFDMNKVARKAAELRKEIDFKFDPKEIVNTDMSLADELWEAGLKLFLETGVYSTRTRRVITFDESEVKHALKNARDRLEVGQGKDKRILYNRGINDNRPPIVFGGPFNCDVSEDMFVRFNEAYAREEIIDLLFLPGYLKTIHGLDIRPDSGLSGKTVILYARWSREAIERAGRPGLAIVGHGIMGLNDQVAIGLMKRLLEKVVSAKYPSLKPYHEELPPYLLLFSLKFLSHLELGIIPSLNPLLPS